MAFNLPGLGVGLGTGEGTGDGAGEGVGDSGKFILETVSFSCVISPHLSRRF